MNEDARQQKMIAAYVAFSAFSGLSMKVADLADDPIFDIALEESARLIVKIHDRAVAAEIVETDPELKKEYGLLANRISKAFSWAPNWRAEYFSEASK